MKDISINIVQEKPAAENPLTEFAKRVREHREKGLAPAGQVHPPPQPKKS